MGESEKHSLRNGIIATVVGGLILSGIGYIWFFVPSVARWLAAIIVGIWRYITADAAIPRWFLWLLFILSLATIVRVIQPIFKSRSNEPKLNMYTEDKFFGVIWRWSYPFNNFLQTVQGYCPTCDTMLVYSEYSPYYERSRTSFSCELCGKTVAELEGDKDYAMSMLARQIDRKIRNGEWKQVVTAPSNNSFNRTRN